MLDRTFISALVLPRASLALAQVVSQRVDVNGMRMYYEALGSGDALIVLHGVSKLVAGSFACVLESDGGDQFFCGGGGSGKVRAVRRLKRGSAKGQVP